jgi:hypothetical protein
MRVTRRYVFFIRAGERVETGNNYGVDQRDLGINGEIEETYGIFTFT